MKSKLLLAASLVAGAMAHAPLAHATPGGVSGYSGNPAQGSRNCMSCHWNGGVSAPTVTISGPTTVAPGSTNPYILRITGGPGAGGALDVSASGGTLSVVANQGTWLKAGEIAHNNPKPATAGATEFLFNWTAPATAGTATLYGAGLSLDMDGSDGGDEVGLARLAIAISAPSNQAPVAKAGGPYTVTVGDPIVFSGSQSSDADGTIASYSWNFGDGSMGAGVSPSHTYLSAGIYNVSLTVTDNAGATNTATTTATVNMPANSLPTANAGGPYAGLVGALIAFSGSKSTDSDGTLVSYNWDFGDGSTGSGVNASHAYAAAGIYNVSLTVTDNAGATNTATTTATVSMPANALPTANAGGPYAGLVGELIAFSGSKSTDSDGTLVSYSWDFGDGSMGNGASVSHAYAAAGTYSVKLTVTDDKGGTASASSTAVISQPAGPNQNPLANAGGPYLTAKKNRRICMNASGSSDPDGQIVSYSWDFGDGTVSNSGPLVCHRFPALGEYTVTLTVTDDRGGTAEVTTKATVTGR